MADTAGVRRIVFFVALVVIGSAYWIYGWGLSRGVAVDQAIIFRPDGDSDYFPLVKPLSRFDLGEASVRELAHSGVRSFPITPIIFHAMAVRIFGDTGFVVAEVLLFLLYGWALSRLLETAGIKRHLAEALALIVMGGVAGEAVVSAAKLTRSSVPLAFWSSRFPRPSVTELFVVVFFILAIRLLLQREKAPRRDWLLIGFTGGWVVQADICQGVNLAAIGLLVAAWLLLKAPRRALPGLCAAAAAAAIALCPFVYQRLHELPDVPRRWGAFTTGHHFYLFMPGRIYLLVVLGLIIAGVFSARGRGYPGHRMKAAAAVIGTCAAVSLFSGSLSLFLLGKGIQIYHYIVGAELDTGYLLLVGCGWMLQAALGWAQRQRFTGMFRPWVRAAATVALAAACVAASFFFADRSRGEVWWGRMQPKAPDPHIRNLVDGHMEGPYRAAFTGLHAVLAKPEFQKAEVLATFDGQLANWWEFEGRYLYLPDLFNSTVSDQEVEQRVFSLMRILEVTPEEFGRLLENWFFQFRVLSGAKYQANMAYTPWPLSEYSPEARARIARRPILQATLLETPRSETQRLMDAYTHFDPATQPERKLDLLILSQGDLRELIHPERGRFSRKWQNHEFEIWAPENAVGGSQTRSADLNAK